MALIQPLTLNPDRAAQLLKASAKAQEAATVYTRSHDEENFPVFRNPNHGQYILYIPNITTTDEGGELVHQMTTARIHTIKGDSKFGDEYRCTRGVIFQSDNPDESMDGGCPMCDLTSAQWDDYKNRLALYDLKNGTAIEADKSEGALKVKEAMRSSFVADSTIRHFFPGYIFELETVGNSTVIKKDTPPKMYWMDITANQKREKFDKALALAPNSSLAGKVMLLNFGRDPQAQVRDAVRSMTVQWLTSDLATQVGVTPEVMAQADAIAEDWTPLKAMTTIKRLDFYPMSALEQMIAVKSATLQHKASQTLTELASLAGAPAGASKGIESPKEEVVEATVIEVVPDSTPTTPTLIDSTGQLDVNAMLNPGL